MAPLPFVRRTALAAALLTLCSAASPPQNDPAAGQRLQLLERDRIGLTLPAARLILEGAEARALSMGLKVNISVVDDGGHLLAFARMDGARPASAYTAITKAVSAATMRQPTGPVPPGVENPDPLLNLSLQLTAAAGGAKVTTLYGGLPVVVEGKVAGAVGVGGATGEQDAEIARAGIQNLLDHLTPSQPSAPPSNEPQKERTP